MICDKVEKTVGRTIIMWIFTISSLLTYIIINQENRMFRFGPNPDLYILGICIDNTEKYLVVVGFCLINSGMRTLNHNILQSWIINTVQDPKTTTQVNPLLCYELSLTATTYAWFDFFMYMNILMAQIDMLLMEIGSDIIMTSILTTYYLKRNQTKTTDDSFS
jgi:hypothetical protein